MQRSTGGKERLGRTSRMGERTLRRLLITGASEVVRWAELARGHDERSSLGWPAEGRRKGVAADTWLGRMLARKAPMLVIVALANKTARVAWALLTKGGIYRAPAVSASAGRTRGCRWCEEVKGQVWRDVGKAGPGEPGARGALRARSSDVVPTLAIPYGPVATVVPHQRPDTWQHPITRSACSDDFPCTRGGVHTCPCGTLARRRCPLGARP